MKDSLSSVLRKSEDILKEHNGVYLEKKLYTTLKKEFPDLRRNDFRTVLEELLESDYILDRNLIRPVKDKKSKNLPEKDITDKKKGKGSSDHLRIPDKRI
jgi:NurA-like 5'-3' nuclease